MRERARGGSQAGRGRGEKPCPTQRHRRPARPFPPALPAHAFPAAPAPVPVPVPGRCRLCLWPRSGPSRCRDGPAPPALRDRLGCLTSAPSRATQEVKNKRRLFKIKQEKIQPAHPFPKNTYSDFSRRSLSRVPLSAARPEPGAPSVGRSLCPEHRALLISQFHSQVLLLPKYLKLCQHRFPQGLTIDFCSMYFLQETEFCRF